jgi:hypothetical protein
MELGYCKFRRTGLWRVSPSACPLLLLLPPPLLPLSWVQAGKKKKEKQASFVGNRRQRTNALPFARFSPAPPIWESVLHPSRPPQNPDKVKSAHFFFLNHHVFARACALGFGGNRKSPS